MGGEQEYDPNGPAMGTSEDLKPEGVAPEEEENENEPQNQYA